MASARRTLTVCYVLATLLTEDAMAGPEVTSQNPSNSIAKALTKSFMQRPGLASPKQRSVATQISNLQDSPVVYSPSGDPGTLDKMEEEIAKLEVDNYAMQMELVGLRSEMEHNSPKFREQVARMEEISEMPVQKTTLPDLAFGFGIFGVGTAVGAVLYSIINKVVKQSRVSSELQMSGAGPERLVGSARGARVAPRSRVMMEATGEEDEVSWDFGDAKETSVIGSIKEEQERELSEREKEIMRLRAAEKFMKQDTGNAICRTCGYMYKWEDGVPGQTPPKTPWEFVPDSFPCPSCKSPKAFFDPEQIEIAGFADNQSYGFGTNTWTEDQKSNAIFGGLAAFFILFLGGYALN